MQAKKMDDMNIEVLMEGGHTIMGSITGAMFGTLMQKMQDGDGGYIRLDEALNYEVAVLVNKIVAVRYLR